MSQSAQATLWPPGFVDLFFPSRYKWAVLGAYSALEPANIKVALEQVKGTPASDVIAALIFQIDCYQITLRAQEATIGRLTAMEKS